MLNLAEFDTGASKGYTFTLRHPSTGEDLDATITLAGPGSDAYEGARESRDGKYKLLLQKYRDSSKIPADELNSVQVNFLARCTTGWSGLSLDGAKETPYSLDAARKLYGNKGLSWVVDQVDKELSDLGNFLPTTSKS